MKHWEAMGTRIPFYEDYPGGVLEGEVEEDKAGGRGTG